MKAPGVAATPSSKRLSRSGLSPGFILPVIKSQVQRPAAAEIITPVQ
jgi:hypothetical protein